MLNSRTDKIEAWKIGWTLPKCIRDRKVGSVRLRDMKHKCIHTKIYLIRIPEAKRIKGKQYLNK